MVVKEKNAGKSGKKIELSLSEYARTIEETVLLMISNFVRSFGFIQ